MMTAHIATDAQSFAATAKALDKIDRDVSEADARNAALMTALRADVEKRHDENKKFIYAILVALIAGLVLKAADYVHFGTPEPMHEAAAVTAPHTKAK